MSWKRFPIPEFDHRSLRGIPFSPPVPISAEEEGRILAAAKAGDASVAGAYAVTPDPALLDRLLVEGEHRYMVLCALPPSGAHVLGRSIAWFNQRTLFLDRNAPDAEILLNWHTPRTHNTRFGPENGVDLSVPYVYLLSGRIAEEAVIGNRVMIDTKWLPSDAAAGFRVISACDKGEDNFHDSCIMISWAA